MISLWRRPIALWIKGKKRLVELSLTAWVLVRNQLVVHVHVCRLKYWVKYMWKITFCDKKDTPAVCLVYVYLKKGTISHHDQSCKFRRHLSKLLKEKRNMYYTQRHSVVNRTSLLCLKIISVFSHWHQRWWLPDLTTLCPNIFFHKMAGILYWIRHTLPKSLVATALLWTIYTTLLQISTSHGELRLQICFIDIIARPCWTPGLGCLVFCSIMYSAPNMLLWF